MNLDGAVLFWSDFGLCVLLVSRYIGQCEQTGSWCAEPFRDRCLHAPRFARLIALNLCHFCSVSRKNVIRQWLRDF